MFCTEQKKLLKIYYFAFTSHQKYKTSCINNKFKISGSTRNADFELLDGSYSLSDIGDYFEYIIKKYETFNENPPIRIYVIEIENRITFRIKTWYYHKLLTSETMKLLGSTKVI